MKLKVLTNYKNIALFNAGDTIAVRFMFQGQTDVELLIDVDKVVFIGNQSGIYIRKRKFKDRLKGWWKHDSN